jgi:hypothetical protein
VISPDGRNDKTKSKKIAILIKKNFNFVNYNNEPREGIRAVAGFFVIFIL